MVFFGTEKSKLQQYSSVKIEMKNNEWFLLTGLSLFVSFLKNILQS